MSVVARPNIQWRAWAIRSGVRGPLHTLVFLPDGDKPREAQASTGFYVEWVRCEWLDSPSPEPETRSYR